MVEVSTIDIFIRLALSIVFSGLIGFEREKSNSNAGMKTHILVGMGATIVALIQVETNYLVYNINSTSKVSVDAVRLIAQVVSGIGFLGAGAIIVTKRNIMGLTTAASIWGTSSIGLALGMGYFRIAIIASILIVIVLIVFKRIWIIQPTDYLLLKYLPDYVPLHVITDVFKTIGLNYETVRISTSAFGNDLITTHVFKIEYVGKIDFDDIALELSEIKNIVSIETTNLG